MGISDSDLLGCGRRSVDFRRILVSISLPTPTPYNVPMKERIQKILGNAGVASRRNIEEMVRQGRIVVNGNVQTDLPILIDPAKDKVHVDGEAIRLRGRRGGGSENTRGEVAPALGKRLYFLLNKPPGVYSTNLAQGAQRRAIDLLPPGVPGRVYPVGQLDAESKGLLLLTNDGELTNRLTHPRYGVPKVYRAIVDGSISPADVAELEKGVWLADPHSGTGFKTGRSHIKIVKRLHERSILDITIREGKNRGVRRMLAKIGHRVRDLTRIKMGPLTLEGLKPGEVRELSSAEVRALRNFTDRPEKSQDQRPAKARTAAPVFRGRRP
ncbi:MAG: pseudouridine synthase [Phycisphaerales bacterium]|nr:pseudouridine synthase [Phycisphaerales bacterium]